jgi:D-alanyl-D-alanine carboxypeptidase/D-alanyl-D-alanine-endopeptidase (penicillin-binding protein 4)
MMARPEFEPSVWGLEIFDIAGDSSLYSWNGEKLMTPASTTKLLTSGTALALLGADHRFRTPVYRTGLVEAGVLRGDLVLVASGDPNLSNRIQGDSLLFNDHDHAYGGPPLAGDPLAPLRDLARQTAASGIRRVTGQARIDASLFPTGEREGGTRVVISPIMINDNLVNVTFTPGAAAGEPARVTLSPDVGYLRLVNEVTTVAAGGDREVSIKSDSAGAGGVRIVTATGSIPVGGEPVVSPYVVPDPVAYAAMAFAMALRDAGVQVTADAATGAALPPPAAGYDAANLVAEHVSPPLSQEVKVTLKVSQNLHASMTPYLLGAVKAGARDTAQQAGFDLERAFLIDAGLDPGDARQSDGAGADAHYTPDFMARYLAYMARREDFEVFRHALPVLGRDGTLWNIQPDAAAAGHVFAKTGTYGVWDRLNRRLVLTAKGLAGYIQQPDGRLLSFAFYVNQVPIPAGLDDGATVIAGQALGELANAAYRLPIGR